MCNLCFINAENRYLKRLENLEHSIDYQNPPNSGVADYTYLGGKYPVLLSAPHAAVHTRKKKLKEEDEYTGAFALLLAELTHAHAILATHKSATDPNKDKDVPYKSQLTEAIGSGKIKFVLDIHGAKREQLFGIALGTMKGRSCPEGQRAKIIDTFLKYGFSKDASDPLMRIDIDSTFPASSDETVTRYVWNKHEIPTMQVEINAILRIVERKNDATNKTPFHGDPAKINLAISTLKEIILEAGR